MRKPIHQFWKFSALANVISASLNPPSGPINSAISGLACASTSLDSLLGASTKRVAGKGRYNHSCKEMGAKI